MVFGSRVSSLIGAILTTRSIFAHPVRLEMFVLPNKDVSLFPFASNVSYEMSHVPRRRQCVSPDSLGMWINNRLELDTIWFQ